jgi:competence protein ComEC
MHTAKIYLWQQAPAIRLLLPFTAGILLQWYLQVPAVLIWSGVAILCCLIFLFALLPLRRQFTVAPLQGLGLSLLVLASAMAVVHTRDIRNNKQWFGKQYKAGYSLLLTLQEPLVEKPNSFKALATVTGMVRNDSLLPATGKLLLYLQKEAASGMGYGTQLLAVKHVEPVLNSGNPAGFDYQRYSLFAGITHQAYLKASDFVVLPKRETNWLRQAIFNTQHALVTILKRYIRGRRESGLAEALLIGYKDDLDKTLVQSYSNTGVVHIIAISGLHVGLIYALLLLLTKPLKGNRARWLRFCLITATLWAFGFLAGAQPSVMRSVVMFTAMAAGIVLGRNASVYNNLALSAFLLLCYNPFWLWDVGFQLSYTAVLSIVVFFKPIYNWIYLPNKILDAVWKLMAVTLAAQILTTPLSLYYFHQFPLLFLVTNIVAVPLSSAVLIGELLLCLFSFMLPVAQALGWLTTGAIRLMNGFIEHLDATSFAVWQGISITPLQTTLLLLFVAGISTWLLEKNKAGFWFAFSCLLLFTALRTFSFLQAAQQAHMVVYNIAKHQAIDVVQGHNALFIGDTALLQNHPAARLHLQPARIAQRIKTVSPVAVKAFHFCNKKILTIDQPFTATTFSKPHVDVLILSRNPKLYIKDLAAAFDIKQIVIDASVPPWKAALWQRDCEAMRIACHNVAQKGAFVIKGPQPTFAAL